MAETRTRDSRIAPADKSPAAIAARTASYKRRLKAAGIDEEIYPEDIEAFRRQLTRRLAMFLDERHGCRELICKRNRGCMAPHNVCANHPPIPPEEARQSWEEVKYEVLAAIQARAAEGWEHDDW